MNATCWRLRERDTQRWLRQMIGGARVMLTDRPQLALRFTSEGAAQRAAAHLRSGANHLVLDAVEGPFEIDHVAGPTARAG
jgi:hypothetical protein